MLARQLRATAGEQHGSVPPIKHAKHPGPAAPAAAAIKPPKTHRLRNFTLLLGLAGAAVYGGGAYLALENDTVYNYYTRYMPGGNAVIDYIENNRARVPQYSTERARQVTDRAVARARTEASKVVEFGKQEEKKLVAKAKKLEQDVEGRLPHAQSTPQPNTSSATAKPQSALSNITGRNFDSKLSALVRTLNDYTKNVNSGRATDSDIAKVTAALQEINGHFADNRKAIEEEIATKLTAQGHALNDELEATKQRLVNVYNNRLESEVQTARANVLAEANNRIHSQYIELNEAFTKRVGKYVDEERDGRLKDLKGLEEKITKLETTLVDTGSAISSNDAVVDYVTQVAQLRTILAGEAQSLAPQLTAIRRSLPDDPLVSAAIGAIPGDVRDYGVLSTSQLAARFKIIAPEIRKASFVPANAGLGGHILSSLVSGVMIQKSGLPEGDDVESILARTETFLSEGKVIDAVAEVNSLKGWPKEIAKTWLQEGRKRSEVEFLTNVLAEEGYLHSVSKK